MLLNSHKHEYSSLVEVKNITKIKTKNERRKFNEKNKIKDIMTLAAINTH
jgi:hypothetical protein